MCYLLIGGNIYMEKLTVKQEKVLNELKKYLAKKGYWLKVLSI